MAFNNLINIVLHDEINDEIERKQINMEHRLLRDESDPFRMYNLEFIKHFRVSKDIAQHVIEVLRPQIQNGLRSTKIPIDLKVLDVFNFLGNGSYQKSISTNINFPMEQSTFSKLLGEITEGIEQYLLPTWVVFPQTEMQLINIKMGFLLYGLRGVIVAIDCTHVAILAPKTDDPVRPGLAYFNRKGYCSINVQARCDSNLKILNCNARFPGSCHDSAIWELSSVRQLLEKFIADELQNARLIGDSGYPLQAWLLTHILDVAENTPQARYNKHLIQARTCIEQCFGLLKGRYRCLLKHRVLHYTPVKASQIIYSCITLRNMIINHRVPHLDLEAANYLPPPTLADEGRVPADIQGGGWLPERRRIQNMLIQQDYL